MEFDLGNEGKPQSVRLFLNNALCEVRWPNGMKLQTFVHADKPVGWFRIKNVTDSFIPQVIPPVYNDPDNTETDADPVTGQDLKRLGYKQGLVKQHENLITYHQEGWGNFSYDVVVKWEKKVIA